MKLLKIGLASLILTISVFANDNNFKIRKALSNNQYKEKVFSVMEELKNIQINNINNLDTYKKRIYSEDIEKSLKKANSPEEMLEIAEGIDPIASEMTLSQKKDLIKKLRYIINKNKGGFDYLLYFYSKSVPKLDVTNILQEIGILQHNGINLNTKQYMIGYPKDYKDYMLSWRDKLNSYPIKQRKYVVNNFHMKLDPRFFEVYDIKEVPAMALVKCKNAIPEPDSCRIYYLSRGLSSVETFFDKISKLDKRYYKYVKILQANDIYIPIKNEEENNNEKDTN